MNRLDRIEKIVESITIEVREFIKETRASGARLDAQLAKTDAQLAKTDAQLARTDVQLAKTDIKLKETRDMLHSIGFNLGIIAEEFFGDCLNESKILGNIHFDRVEFNWKETKKNVSDEFDIVMLNVSNLALIEIKHKVHPADLEKLVT